MKRIVLISCVKSKVAHPAKVRDLYISQWFRLAMQYAKRLKPDMIFILSAEYHLLDLDTFIKPYEKTLKTMPIKEVEKWAECVLGQLRKRADLANDHFIILASEKYRKYLVPHIGSHEIPMQGLGIGKQLQFMKKKISE